MNGEWEAFLVDDILYMGVGVLWRRAIGNGEHQYTNGQTAWIVNTNDVTANPDVQPLRLEDGKARALLAALLRHYNGADDARMLRKDYDAERARVDRLIGALIPGST